MVLFFVLSKWSGFWWFCLLPRHSSRGRNYGRGKAFFFKKKCLMGLYHALLPCILLPAGRKICNLVDSSAPSKYQICIIPTSEVKLKSKKKSDWVTTTKEVMNGLRDNEIAVMWALSLPIAQSYLDWFCWFLILSFHGKKIGKIQYPSKFRSTLYSSSVQLYAPGLSHSSRELAGAS